LPRITAYAERPLNDLSVVEWQESIKNIEHDWIGRSEGAKVDLRLAEDAGAIRVFTTRPVTRFGAAYMVLAPEHPLVKQGGEEDHSEICSAAVARKKS
jgi:leucyl-tRNA synthetase